MKHLLALAPLLVLAFALPAAAEKVSLNDLSNYFNTLRTAEAAFSQTNADGSKSSGTLYIKRPGRIRFEYDPPEKTLVMSGGGQVAIFDPKSNQQPEQYPLKKTPLNLILANNVNLAKAKMVVGHESNGETTSILAQDPEHPEYGTIQLVFTENPIELRQWIITDEGGGKTVVNLNRLKKGGELSSFLFNIVHETEQRNR